MFYRKVIKSQLKRQKLESIKMISQNLIKFPITSFIANQITILQVSQAF